MDGVFGHGNAHSCQLKLKRLSHKLFTPPLTPPRKRGGEVLALDKTGVG